MFKENQDSDLKKDRFSVGSTVEAGQNKWLVIGTKDSKGKYVALLNLHTFIVETIPLVTVGDLGFLTELEARELLDGIGGKLNYAFSDFDLIPRGYKC